MEQSWRIRQEGTYETEEKCMQKFWGGILGKKPLGICRRRRKSNIENGLKGKMAKVAWNKLIWLRKGENIGFCVM